MSVPNFLPIHPADVEIFHWMCDDFDTGFILWGPWMSAQSSLTPVDVEIFQSGSKWWTDQLTSIALPRAMLLSWLKIDKRSGDMWNIFWAAFHECVPPFTHNFSASLPFVCSIMVKTPTTVLCRDAHHFRPIPPPLPHTQPPLSFQLWSTWRDARPVLPVPPRAWGLEETQPRCPSRPGTRSPLQLPAGPSCCPWVPGAAPSSGQLWCALRSGRGLVRSGFRVSEPPRHAAATRGTGGAEGHHHGSPGSQNPEHAAGPQEGVGVSIKEIQRQRIPLQLYV